MRDLLSRYGLSNVYANFDKSSVLPDPTGPLGEDWGGDSPVFGELVSRVRPETVFELGSWKGRSAITMAKACRQLGLTTTIVCIDTWLGAAVHWTEPHWLAGSLQLKHGYPTLYYRFLANVMEHGVSDYVVPLPNTTANAVGMLNSVGATADLIYVDADHQYESVRDDLRRFWPLKTARGVVFGHDWQFESVRRAVEEFARQQSLSVRVQGEFWELVQR